MPRSSRPSPSQWAGQLGRVFERVAVFALNGVSAEVVAVHGIGHAALGASLSLLDRTPLRWAIEAASPVVGAGRSPGGAVIAAALGLETPRAYAVVPLAMPGGIVGLAYADSSTKALSLKDVSVAFSFCERVLGGSGGESRASSRRPHTRRPRSGRPLLARAPAGAIGGAGLPTFAPEEVGGDAAGWPAPVADRPQPAGAPATGDLLADEDAAAFAALVQESMAGLTTALPAQPSAAPDEFGELPFADDELAVIDAALEPVDTGEGAALESELAPPGATVASPPAPEAEPAPMTMASPLVPFPVAPEIVPPVEQSPVAPVRPSVLAASATAAERPRLTTLYAEQVAVVTPAGVIPLDHLGQRGRSLRPLTAVAAAAATAAALLLTLVAPAAHPTAAGARSIVVPQQASLGTIARELESAGLVRSAVGFEWLARLSGSDRALRAGTYHLTPSAWAWEQLRALTGGQVETTSVTVPEGLTLREIAALLESRGVARADELLSAASSPELLGKYGIPGRTAEGYLFPETYVFALGLPAREVVEVMVRELFTRIATLPEAATATRDEVARRVILASIVEREARDRRELARVAGVFQNRLDRNLKLESCATVQFLLGERKERLTVADVRRPSPYNTYLHPDLPPGPIGSPGMEALRAAFAPERHDYLFFFAREDGSHRHVFTRTYAEHMSAQRTLARR